MQCPRCSGDGLCTECNGEGFVDCSACRGKGYTTNELPSGTIVEIKCPRCSGDGTIPCNKKCEVCNGTGVLGAKVIDFPREKQQNNEFIRVFRPFVPKATYTLLALIVIGYLLSGMLWSKGNVLYILGIFYPPFVERGEFWRFITAMFLHGGIIHLLSNSYCLFVLSPAIEHILGVKKFLSLYFISGIVGFLLSMIFIPQAPTVGASGALFGIMAAYLGLQLRNKMFDAHIINQLLFWFVINLFIGFSIPGINIWAHLGGAVAGFAYGYLTKVEL